MMATSGTYSFSVNRDTIIRMALLTIRKLDEIEGPTPQDTRDCSTWLNMMVKQWQGTTDFAPGLKTWMRRRGNLFLSTSTGKYTVGPSGTGWTESFVQTTTTAAAAAAQAVVPVTSVTGMAAGDKFGVMMSSGTLFWGVILSINSLNVTLTSNLTGAVSSGASVYTYTTTAQQPVKIESAVLRNSENHDTPVFIYANTQDYDVLPTKADPSQTGDPTSIYYEFQLGNSFLYTDVGAALDASKRLVLTFLEAVQDFNEATDEPEYPQEWYLPLALGLARLAAPMYGAAWSATNQENYASALAIAQRKEPEKVTMYFQSGE